MPLHHFLYTYQYFSIMSFTIIIMSVPLGSAISHSINFQHILMSFTCFLATSVQVGLRLSLGFAWCLFLLQSVLVLPPIFMVI